jgi:hypothetical protein
MRSVPNIAEYGLISKSRGSIGRSPRYRSPSRFTATATCFDFPLIVSASSSVYRPSVLVIRVESKVISGYGVD